MTRGRKPQSAEEQIAKGSPGKRLSQADEAKILTKKKPVPVSRTAIQPPKWVKKSRKAMEVWNELTPVLQGLNMFTTLDAIAFARYCRYLVEWIAADQAVQKEGTWYDTVGTNGEPTKKRHPAFMACLDIEKRLSEIEPTFGLRPDSRYKIMRDQAAAHGLATLPLWGGQSERPQVETPADEQPDSDQIDAVGRLGAINSLPPERLN